MSRRRPSTAIEDLEREDGSDKIRSSKTGSLPEASYSLPSYAPIHAHSRQRGRLRTAYERISDTLVEYGVESRGIQPRPEDERDELTVWSYFPQMTIWAAWNTNILTFSEGMLGPTLFGLDSKASVLCIVFFTAVSTIPPAYLASIGPKTGMRQMVQARYGLGWIPALFIGLVNCISQLGFLALTVILGGQSLSLASGGSMSWTVGIVVAAIISLLLSFIGLRALHILSLGSFPVILILFIVIAGVTGTELRMATSELAKAASHVTASGVLGYGASLIGFTVSYASLAADYTTTLPPHTPQLTLFICVYFALFLPITLVQIFGAAAQAAALAIPDWLEASEIGVPNLLYAMTGSGHAARFVMVLLCLSVCANTAPTIYSCGLSGQVAVPWLVRVPRYFLALIVSAVYLPVAIVGATHFYTALENFLSVLAYWTCLYVPPVVIDPLIFRSPVSRKTYPLEIWDQPSKLPWGLAAAVAAVCGVPLIAAGMAQTWWTGWIARKIEGGAGGDIAFEMAFPVVAIVYLVCRYLERKHTGR